MMQTFRRLGLSWWTLVLFAIVGSVLGVGLFTFYYAKGGSYFSSDPKGCVNCHIMRDQYDSWQKASHHANATCIDCHLPHNLVGKYVAKAENGYHHSAAFTLQDFPDPILIKKKNSDILQLTCIQCHQGLVNDLVNHGAFADGSNRCVRCHASVGHGSTR